MKQYFLSIPLKGNTFNREAIPHYPYKLPVTVSYFSGEGLNYGLDPKLKALLKI